MNRVFMELALKQIQTDRKTYSNKEKQRNTKKYRQKQSEFKNIFKQREIERKTYSNKETNKENNVTL